MTVWGGARSPGLDCDRKQGLRDGPRSRAPSKVGWRLPTVTSHTWSGVPAWWRWPVWWDWRLPPCQESEMGSWELPRGEEVLGERKMKVYGKTKLQGYEDWLGNETVGFELWERRQGLRSGEGKPGYGAHGQEPQGETKAKESRGQSLAWGAEERFRNRLETCAWQQGKGKEQGGDKGWGDETGWGWRVGHTREREMSLCLFQCPPGFHSWVWGGLHRLSLPLLSEACEIHW